MKELNARNISLTEKQSDNGKVFYQVNYATELDYDAIYASLWGSISGNLTIENESFTTSKTKALISGVPGQYRLINQVLTVGGERFERFINITIEDSGFDSQLTGDLVPEPPDPDPVFPGHIQFASTAYTVVESVGTIYIEILRAGGSDGAVTVDYATSINTATAADFTAAAGTVSFADGETTKSIPITILTDAVLESAENFQVTLSNPTGGATLNTDIVTTVTIIEGPGVLAFSTSTYTVSESGTSITIPVYRTTGVGGSVSVSYVTSDGTATAGADYTATSGVITFADGDSIENITIPIIQDSLTESSETFSLTLSSPTGGASLGSIFSTTITITDDDLTADWYISTTGSDSNPGTSPTDAFETIGKLLTVISASETCHMMGGTYNISSQVSLTTIGGSGTETTLEAAPGETVILDFATAVTVTNRGLNFNGGSHWIIKGIEVRNAPSQGFRCVSTCDNILFEDCTAAYNGRLNTEGAGWIISGASSNVRFIGCYAHHNVDQGGGGNSDGFTFISNTGAVGHSLIDCLAYRNGDDGFDVFKATCPTIDFTRCISVQNGLSDAGASLGDGNGFKLGDSAGVGTRICTLKNCVAAENRQNGFHWNGQAVAHFLYNCTAYDNNQKSLGATYDYNFGGGSGSSTLTLKNSIAYLTPTLVNLPSSANITYNTWNLSITNPQFANTTYGNASYLRLGAGSPCIDVGLDVGIAYNGANPDLGAYETD